MALSIFLMMTVFSHAHATEKCSSYLSSRASHPLLPSLGGVTKFKYLNGNSLITAEHFLDRGFSVQVVKSRQVERPNEFERERLGTDEVSRFSSELALAVKKHYPRRGWSEKFINKVSQNIESDFGRSDFLIIRDPETQEILATMRIISSPYTHYRDAQGNESIQIFGSGDPRLPVEQVFNRLTFKREQMFIKRQDELLGIDDSMRELKTFHSLFEISSLTVAKTERRKELVSLMFKYILYLSFYPSASKGSIRYTFLDSVNLFSQSLDNPLREFIHAYGDRIGERMYRPYSLKPNEDSPSQEIEGEKWRVLSATGSFFKATMERLGIDPIFYKEAFQLYKKRSPRGAPAPDEQNQQVFRVTVDSDVNSSEVREALLEDGDFHMVINYELVHLILREEPNGPMFRAYVNRSSLEEQVRIKRALWIILDDAKNALKKRQREVFGVE